MQRLPEGNKVALVTGAAGVLGFATAKALLARGLSVAMADLDKAKLLRLYSELEGKMLPVEVNLVDLAGIDRAYSKVRQELGEVDILVNNAGVLSTNKCEATSIDEWRNVIDVNLQAVFYLSRLVIPGMKRRGWGRIVNIASMAARTGGITAGTAYTASKGGVISLTYSLAAELASFGITVNGIAPGYVKTPMVMEQLTEEQRQGLLKKIPVGRFCEPEEVAHVVCFLLDDLSGCITGEIIDQNGGLHFS